MESVGRAVGRGGGQDYALRLPTLHERFACDEHKSEPWIMQHEGEEIIHPLYSLRGGANLA